jgi:hypothetical protein
MATGALALSLVPLAFLFYGLPYELRGLGHHAFYEETAVVIACLVLLLGVAAILLFIYLLTMRCRVRAA